MMFKLWVVSSIASILVLCGVAKAVSPDPPPGSTKTPRIVQTEFVCAFNMVKLPDLYEDHDMWEVGNKRWCKYVTK